MTVGGLSLDVDVSGLEDLRADVDAFPQGLARDMGIAMDLSLHHLVGQVRKRTPVNVATLRNSIGQSTVSEFPNLVGRVGSPLPYSIVIEEGRKFGPGAKFPPIDAIKAWAVRKLGISPDEADSAAFLIARSIKEKGFSEKGEVGPTGARMFEEGLEAATPNINRLFEAAVARSVRRFNQS
jgi:hypothetical protein